MKRPSLFLSAQHRAVFLAACTVVAATIVLLLFARTTSEKRLLDNIQWTASFCSAPILTWMAFKGAEPNRARVLRSFSWALTWFACCQIVWFVQEAVHWTPFPAPSMVFALLVSPVLCVGFSRELHGRIAERRGCGVALDLVCMLVGSLLITLALYLPSIGGTPPTQFAALVAFPVAFAGALSFLAVIVLYVKPRSHPSLWLVAGGLAVLSTVWLVWNKHRLDNTFTYGGVESVAFSIGALLVGPGFAGWSFQPTDRYESSERLDAILKMVPMLAVIAAAVATVLGFQVPGLAPAVRTTLVFCGVALAILAIVRQGILMADLQRSERRYALAANGSLDGIWEWDFLRGGAFFSSRCIELMGLAREPYAATRESWLSALNSDDRKQVSVALDRHIREEAPFDVEFRVETDGGGVLWRQTRGQAIRDSSGRPLRMAGSVRDIDKRKRVEEALAASEQLNSRILATTPDTIWIVDLDCRDIVFVNRSITERLGYPASEFAEYAEHTLALLTHPQDRDRMNGELGRWQHIGDEALVTREFRLRDANRCWRWFRAAGAVFERNDDGMPTKIIEVVRDVTEVREWESQLRELNQTLEQRVADRTAELSATNKELEAFAYSVSHDLRSPLRALNGFAMLLEESLGEQASPAQIHSIERIRVASTQMGSIIDSLLVLSKVTRAPMRWETLDLSSMARIWASNRQIEDPDRKVEWDIQETPLVRGDPTLAMALIDNLLGNAYKYTRRLVDPASIAFGANNREEDRIELFVKDNGAGFDMAHAGLLFRPFQRLHRQDEFEGTGIGLATVLRIVQRHGGTIRAEGAIDSGATFIFSLPAAVESR